MPAQEEEDDLALSIGGHSPSASPDEPEAPTQMGAHVPQLAPQPGQYTEPADYKGLAIKGAVAVAVLTVLLIGGLYGYRHFKGSVGPIEAAATVPQDSLAVVAFAQPERTIKEVVKSLDQTFETMPMLQEDWSAAKDSIRQDLGFSLSQTESYASAGIDLSQPLTLALLALGEDQAPTGGVISISTTTYQKGLDVFKACAKAAKATVEEDKSGQPTVYVAGSVAMAIEDGRMYVFGGPGEGLAKGLRDFLKKRGEQPLKDAPAFKETLAGLGKVGHSTGYLNLAPVKKAAGKTAGTQVLQELQGIACTGSDSEGSIYFHCAPNASLMSGLEMGDECKPFLQKLGRAPVVITYSLGNPMQSLQNLVTKSGGGTQWKALDAQANGMIGMTLTALGKLLAGGAGGLAVYPGDETNPIPGVVLFAKLSDKKQLDAALKKTYAKNQAVQQIAHGQDVLYKIPIMTAAVLIGIREDYFILATGSAASEEALALKGSWSDAPLGGKELIGGYFDPVPFFKAYESLIPEAYKSQMAKAKAQAAPFSFTLEKKESGLRVAMKSEGDVDFGASMFTGVAQLALFAMIFDPATLPMMAPPPAQ